MKILTKKRLGRILKRMELRINKEVMLRNYAYTERLRLYSDIKRILLGDYKK